MANKIKQYLDFFVRLLLSSSLRKKTFWRYLLKNKINQVSNYTEENRYPDLFKICKDYFSTSMAPRLLSFGCSTGEEVISLNKYLPNATIIGTDINKWCIEECQKKSDNQKLLFIHSLSGKYKRARDFDAIFCLAVFQHTKNRAANQKIAIKFTFKRFENQLQDLDEKLKENGLLFIDHSDFDFRNTSLYKKYSVLDIESNSIFRDRPLYNKNNERISESTFMPRVFVKNQSVTEGSVEEII